MKANCTQCARNMQLFYHFKDEKRSLEVNFCSTTCGIVWMMSRGIWEYVRDFASNPRMLRDMGTALIQLADLLEKKT